MSEGKSIRVVVIGAGPAGLTAAYKLTNQPTGVEVIVLESDPTYVGGISKTVQYKGYRFDIGGHRFFSKSKEVEDFWTEILPNDMLERPRKSRIYYDGKYFSYPLQAVNALTTLGVFEASRCVISYAQSRLRPNPDPKSFEEWVINKFGKRLYEIFFKTYTEKVWGMPCREISADWAAQRIKGLSLSTAIWNALKPKAASASSRTDVVKTLIDSFRYPRLGPGMMWEKCAERIQERGGTVLMGRKVVRCEYNASANHWIIEHVDSKGEDRQRILADHVISSAPMREMVQALLPEVPASVREAAKGLRYRDFIVVALVVKERGGFDDQWIYIQDPGVKVGRIQNFKSWSPEMVPNSETTCYGLEYFCFEGDGLWTSKDEDLLAKAQRELLTLGLAKPGDVIDGYVVRQPKAYPVYDEKYVQYVKTIREAIEGAYPGLHLVGRNGMHKYNNQDHSMMTAMLVVENILSGEMRYDVWHVNEDAEYHESGRAGAQQVIRGLRAVPMRIVETIRDSVRPPPPPAAKAGEESGAPKPAEGARLSNRPPKRPSQAPPSVAPPP